MRGWAAVTCLALALIAGRSEAADTRLADMVLGEVGASPVMLSDVTLARALGLFGLEPSSGPITDEQLARYLDAQLAVRGATQLALEVAASDIDRAWARAGGPGLAARLEAAAIDPAWAQRLLEADLRVERFVDLRFREFAFVTEFDVDEALGPGPHGDAARGRARERLRADMVARAYAGWQADARQRTPIRQIPGIGGPWPAPFSLDRP